MQTRLQAIYSNGNLKLLQPVAFAENQKVSITVNDESEIEELIDYACIRRAAKNADDTISIFDVRKLLSGGSDTLSETVIQNRNE